MALTQNGEPTSMPSVLLSISTATLIDEWNMSEDVTEDYDAIKVLATSVNVSIYWLISPFTVSHERVGVFLDDFFNFLLLAVFSSSIPSSASERRLVLY